MEKIIKYDLLRRIGYARRNNYFLKTRFLGIKLPWIPSSIDIHVHNIWKDIKKKHHERPGN